MSNSRIKDLSERNTLTSGDYFVTDNNSGTRKVDVNKVLNPISDAQTTADNVAKKVSKSSDAFSSSKGYSVGELCIYNNKVYRCKTSYSTGASWASRSTYFEEVSLVDAVSDLNNDLNNKYTFVDFSRQLSIVTNSGTQNVSFEAPYDGLLCAWGTGNGSTTEGINIDGHAVSQAYSAATSMWTVIVPMKAGQIFGGHNLNIYKASRFYY